MGNQTGNLSLGGMTPNPLSHTGQGYRVEGMSVFTHSLPALQRKPNSSSSKSKQGVTFPELKTSPCQTERKGPDEGNDFHTS